jgi:ketosteroid isomerase-like protein
MNNALEFVKNVYRDVDSLDASKLVAHLTPDCTFIFGNAEPIIGHQAIIQYIGGFGSMVAGLAHDVDEVWTIGEMVFICQRVTYTRMDGSQVSYPAAVVWRMKGQYIDEFRIYVDNSTLFAAA